MDSEQIKSKLIEIAILRLHKLTEMVNLAEQERSILVEGRNWELMDNIRAQDLATAELSQLLAQEDNLSDLLSSHTTAQPAPDFKLAYESVATKAVRAAERLRTIIRHNTELLDNAMQYVTFSLGILSTLANEQQSYDPQSDTEAKSLAIMLDRKA